MKYLAGLITGVSVTILGGVVAAASWWIVISKPDAKKSEKPAPPAAVTKVLKEDSLLTVKLNPEAKERLGILTSLVEKKKISRARFYGGEVVIPTGQSILVSAPFSGILKGSSAGELRPGQMVKKGQPILVLLPLLTPEGKTTLAASKVDAEGQVENAKTALDGAKIAFDRAKKLHEQGAGSKRVLDESKAQFDIATKTLEAANARLKLLELTVGEFSKGTASPITLEAPRDGILRNLSALPDQNVPSGAVLFEILDLSKVWIRVPVYVGDVVEIAETEPASLSNLSTKAGESIRTAKPILAPPSANALASTIDLFFEVDNANNSLIPGQRVGVSVPLRGEKEGITVPWSSIVHDIYGGTWVYEELEDRLYTRRRVSVQYVLNDRAVLASGIAEGKKIVSQGAAELFGTETGFSK